MDVIQDCIQRIIEIQQQISNDHIAITLLDIAIAALQNMDVVMTLRYIQYAYDLFDRAHPLLADFSEVMDILDNLS